MTSKIGFTLISNTRHVSRVKRKGSAIGRIAYIVNEDKILLRQRYKNLKIQLFSLPFAAEQVVAKVEINNPIFLDKVRALIDMTVTIYPTFGVPKPSCHAIRPPTLSFPTTTTKPKEAPSYCYLIQRLIRDSKADQRFKFVAERRCEERKGLGSRANQYDLFLIVDLKRAKKCYHQGYGSLTYSVVLAFSTGVVEGRRSRLAFATDEQSESDQIWARKKGILNSTSMGGLGF
ncbi:tyrosine-protein phosphatase non-receptor type 1 [Striga asiatica]|uniref:Tyrosine-protein phosphatase non-receptor type 1 n=1 Tax=Striga asiatica TaxID=4170 RepID=A0A5A7PYE4_STRAF|nr:tyrosine-protein phosphatase non-receptor type 1 [Striga asiatica]